MVIRYGEGNEIEKDEFFNTKKYKRLDARVTRGVTPSNRGRSEQKK